MMESLLAARSLKIPATRSSVANPALCWENVYAFQDDLLSRIIPLEGKTIGYKLSTRAGRNPVTLEKTPAYGHLLESMKHQKNCTLFKSHFIDLLVECEIALILDKDILASNIHNKNDLIPYIKEIATALELPDIRFKDPLPEITGLDLVSDNLAAAGFILGEGKSIHSVNLETISVVLKRNHKIVNEGSASELEVAPLDILFWLVKALDQKNISLLAGQVLLTGAIGKFAKGSPGKYSANFSQLGKIEFEIK